MTAIDTYVNDDCRLNLLVVCDSVFYTYTVSKSYCYVLFASYDENDDQSDAIVQQKFLPGVK